METVIQVSELTKTYKDVVAVDHLTFCVGESEIFGLLGVNEPVRPQRGKGYAAYLSRPPEISGFLDIR